jgi:hypothetical protein
MKVLNNEKMVDAVITFPSLKERSEFFETNCLEKHGISEDTLNTQKDCYLSKVGIITLANIIKFAKDNFDAEFHVSCGGDSLNDCNNYEKKRGSLCNYCQYMEFFG